MKQPRRISRQLEELPSLFDDIGIDINRSDIAADIITRHRHVTEAKETARSLSVDTAAASPGRHVKFISFGSGSSGNCAYIGSRSGGILIDAGVDNNYVTDQLLHNGIDIDSIKGIILTHDHSDHVKYAYALLRRRTSTLLYCTPKTLNGLMRRHNISRRIKDYHHAIYKEFPFEVAGMTVTPFETSHDGSDNVGFSISAEGLTFVVTTDTGYITERADYYMRRANYLMIESDYDLDMLRRGRYPEYLKARIISDTGHLDNMVTARYLADIWTPVLREVYLCHLSQDNNAPEIALAAVRERLAERNISVVTDDSVVSGEALRLSALPRFKSSPLYILRPVEE